MDILEMLDKQLCEPRLKAHTKTDAIREMADLLKRSPKLKDVSADDLYEALMAREALGTTGFGNSIAIPHCKIKGLPGIVLSLALSPSGVEFESLDKHRVHLFGIIVGPEDQPTNHVKMLAEVSRVFREESHRRELRNSKSQLALYEGFLRYALYNGETGDSKHQKLVMLVIQHADTLNTILEIFVEMGIRGASVMVSEGMGSLLSNVPLFTSFINFLGGEEEYHRTLFAIMPEKQVPRLVEEVEEITGDLDKHTGVMIMALDIAMMKGSLEIL